MIIGLHSKIEKLVPLTNVASEVKQCLLNSIVKRLFAFEQRNALQIATLLDPRMKKAAFRSTENSRNAQKLLEEEVSVLLKRMKNPAATITSQSEPRASTSTMICDDSSNDGMFLLLSNVRTIVF